MFGKRARRGGAPREPGRTAPQLAEPPRGAAERALYRATLVMRGTGPAGALDGYLKPPRNGKFMKLFLLLRLNMRLFSVHNSPK